VKPYVARQLISDAESVEQTALLFVTFSDVTFFLLKRSDARYAIMFVIFDDKKMPTLQSPCRFCPVKTTFLKLF